MTPIELPLEILFHIFQYMQVSSLFRMTCISKQISQICFYTLNHQHKIETTSFNFKKVEIVTEHSVFEIKLFVDSSILFNNALKFLYLRWLREKCEKYACFSWNPYESDDNWWNSCRIDNLQTHLRLRMRYPKDGKFKSQRIRRNVKQRWDFFNSKTSVRQMNESCYIVFRIY